MLLVLVAVECRLLVYGLFVIVFVAVEFVVCLLLLNVVCFIEWRLLVYGLFVIVLFVAAECRLLLFVCWIVFVVIVCLLDCFCLFVGLFVVVVVVCYCFVVVCWTLTARDLATSSTSGQHGMCI